MKTKEKSKSRIAKLEQEIEKYRLAIASQLCGNSGGCVAQLRATAAEFGINKEMGTSDYGGDPRGRHPEKWAKIRRLQEEMAEINARFSEEAQREVARVQAKINKIWQEMQCKAVA
jgi:hypothetical protein